MALAFSLPLIMAPVYKTLYLVVPLLPCVSFVRFFPVLLILRIRRECDARRGGVECWCSTCGDFCRGNSAAMQPTDIRESLKFHGRRGLISISRISLCQVRQPLQHRQALLWRATVPMNGPHHPWQVRRVEYASRNAKCVTMMPSSDPDLLVSFPHKLASAMSCISCAM
jgi:hypothetical protein